MKGGLTEDTIEAAAVETRAEEDATGSGEIEATEATEANEGEALTGAGAGAACR